MSFLAKLEIDGEVMNVLEFQCTLAQDTDKSGKPSADPAGLLSSLQKAPCFLSGW
jgi:hypothetical protein